MPIPESEVARIREMIKNFEANFEDMEVVPDGRNITGSGILDDPFGLSSSILVDCITASIGFRGNGAQLSHLTASRIDNFRRDVKRQFSAGPGLSYNPYLGIFSLDLNPDLDGYTPIIKLDTNLTGFGSTNNPIRFQPSITASYITATVGFNGNGSQITHLTAANWDNTNGFASDIRNYLLAGNNITIDFPGQDGKIAISASIAAGTVITDGINILGDGTGGDKIRFNPTITASYITASTGFSGSGANITDLTASNWANGGTNGFTDDVYYRLASANTNLIVNKVGDKIELTATVDPGAISTQGNIIGDGSSNNPIRTNTFITASAFSASIGFSGSGENIFNLTASNINNFNIDVRTRFNPLENIYINNSNGDITASVKTENNITGSGITGDKIGLNQNININSITASNGLFNTLTASVGVSSSNGIFNNLTASSGISASIYVGDGSNLINSNTNTANNITGSGTNLNPIGLKHDSITVQRVTASVGFSGSGANVTDLTGSNWYGGVSGFQNDVRKQLFGTSPISYNNSTGEISYTGISSVFTDEITITGSGTSLNKIRLKDNISIQQITASTGFSGSGANIINLTGSNWANGGVAGFSTDIKNRLKAGNNIVITGPDVNNEITIGATGLLSSVVTANNITGSGISGDAIGLKHDSITVQRVTASVGFNGNGTGITNISRANWSSASPGSTYNFNNEAGQAFTNGTGISISLPDPVTGIRTITNTSLAGNVNTNGNITGIGTVGDPVRTVDNLTASTVTLNSNANVVLEIGSETAGSPSVSYGYIRTTAGSSNGTLLVFGTKGVNRAFIDNAGHFCPVTNNIYDLGNSLNRWRDIWASRNIEAFLFTGSNAQISIVTSSYITVSQDIKTNNLYATRITASTITASTGFKGNGSQIDSLRSTNWDYISISNPNNDMFGDPPIDEYASLSLNMFATDVNSILEAGTGISINYSNNVNWSLYTGGTNPKITISATGGSANPLLTKQIVTGTGTFTASRNTGAELIIISGSISSECTFNLNASSNTDGTFICVKNIGRGGVKFTGLATEVAVLRSTNSSFTFCYLVSSTAGVPTGWYIV